MPDSDRNSIVAPSASTSGNSALGSPTAITLVAHEVGPFGGMERQLMNLVEGLLSRGHEVTVVARKCVLSDGSDAHFRRVRCIRRPFVLAYPLFAVVASWKVGRHRQGLVHATGAVVFNKVDVITVHLVHRAIAGVKGLVRSSKQTLPWRIHGHAAAALSRLGERWAYRPSRVRQVVAVSPGGLRELVESFPGLTDIAIAVPNGVDQVSFDVSTEKRAPLEADRLVAVFVGSEWDGKGLRHAIEALSLTPAWNLAVVGTGDRARYENLARERGVGERVHFYGWRSDVDDFYRRADAFVLPSSYETFSLATFEAAGAGLPLLVSRVRGVEDAIRDGVTGWYVDQDARDIARRLDALVDPTTRDRMGSAAREVASNFSWAAMVDGYADIYARLSR